MTQAQVERVRASAAELHALDESGPGAGGERRGIFLLEATAPALVLGSTQPEDHVDHDKALAASVDVVRRRSGGGAVWVTPEDPIWIDVWIPRDDSLWDDDVGQAFTPIGAAMTVALRALSAERGGEHAPDLAPHAGPMVRTDASRMVCFAGVGPGEVMWQGRKLVGMSQRRTRAGARFQCALYRRWNPQPLRELLVEPPPLVELESSGAGLDDIAMAEVEPDELVEYLGRALSTV